MSLEVGSVVEGRVTGVTKFGAFVALPDGKSGLVHISEIANSYVSDVNEFVQLGQTVKVRILSVSPEGKVNLSMKRAMEDAQPMRPNRPAAPRPAPRAVNYTVNNTAMEVSGPSDDLAFEERLKRFMQESDSRMADKRQYFEHRSRTRRR